MKEGDCKSQGYTVLDGTKEKVIPVIGDVKMSYYTKPKAEVKEPSDVTLFRIEHGECGQAKINSKYETTVEKWAGLQEGTCSDQGYTKEQGVKDYNIPVVGDVQFALFSKPATKAEQVTLYKIEYGECGQATVNQNIEKYAEEFAGLTEGKCADQGYTVVDGQKEIHVPVVGDIEISLFSKASEVEEYVKRHGVHNKSDRHARKFLKGLRKELGSLVHMI